jgi:hypothetical protein
MRTKAALGAIWCCFLVRAIFYCTAIPLWEGYDEYSHFAVIQYVALHGGPPDPRTANSSRQVAESRKLVPAPWILHDNSAGLLSYEDYWRLSVAEQQERREGLRNLPEAWSHQDATPRLPLYEAQQPPMYYWLMTPAYWMMRGLDLPTMVWILRCLTALIASTVIPVAFFTAWRVFRSEPLALGVAVVIASLPELLISICRVSNEGLAIALGSLAVLGALRLQSAPPTAAQGATFGATLGAALLTKAYFLALIPFAATVLVVAWRKHPALRTAAAAQAMTALLISFAICGWWYIRQGLLTGSITGLADDIASLANAKISLVDAIWQIRWPRVLDFVAVSHIWLGGWSFLVVRSWMYHLVELVCILSVAGAAVLVCFRARWLPEPRDLLLLAFPYVTLILGLCYNAVEAFRSRGAAATVGYYLYALVVPEVIVLVSGLARWMGPVRPLLPIPILSFVFIGLELFGTWIVMLPYYTGMVQHTSTGGLPAFQLSQLTNHGAATFVGRLSLSGPSLMSVSGLVVIIVGYFLATVGLLWMSCLMRLPPRGTND